MHVQQRLRVVGYARVSTEEQASHGVSLDAQEQRIRGYCVAQGWELTEVIRDEGQSGKSLQRPGMQEALGKLRQGAADGLVVVKLDRLSRKVRDVCELVEDVFDKRGKHLCVIEMGIDTSTPHGKAFLHVAAAFAQLEREEINRRTKQALQHKIARGERCGKVRYGYDLAPDGVRLVDNPAEQEVIAQMLLWRDNSWSYREIAEELNARGTPTKENRTWAGPTVRQIVLRSIEPSATPCGITDSTAEPPSIRLHSRPESHSQCSNDSSLGKTASEPA